ncbi:flagellar biosynthesis anti-sigma factor FlgM [Acidisoma sp. 7E03]
MSRINSYPTSGSVPAASEAAPQVTRAQSKDAALPSYQSAAPAIGGEAATITDGARATAQLLDHARAADGVDHAAVTRLRTAIHAGTYDVSPDALAASISTALSEVKP